MAHWVSFYSYKGGVGRSVSLVNSAYELARLGKTVTMIDFDTEAPGLQYYGKVIDPDASAIGKLTLQELLIKTCELYWDAFAIFIKNNPDFLEVNRDLIVDGKKPLRFPWERLVDLHDVRVLVGSIKIIRLKDRDLPDNRLNLIPFTDLDDTKSAHTSFDKHIDWHLLFGEKVTTIRIDSQTCDDPLYEEKLQSERGFGYYVLRDLRKTISEKTSGGKRSQIDYILADMRTGASFSSQVLINALSDAMVIASSMHRQSVEGIISFMKGCNEVPSDLIIPVLSPLVSVSGLKSGIPSPLSLYEIEKYLSEAIGVKKAKVHQVPFDPRIAVSESILVKHTFEKVGAPQAYRDLAVRIAYTNPAEMQKKIADVDEAVRDFAEVRKRREHFKKLLDTMHSESPWEERVLFFGGISGNLSRPDIIDTYISWLKRSQEAKLFICYESLECALSRARRLGNLTIGETNATKRMEDKHFKWTQIRQEILNRCDDSDRSSLAGRVFCCELVLPLTQYILVADREIYVAPVTEKRSSESCSLLLEDSASEIRKQTIAYLEHHLIASENSLGDDSGDEARKAIHTLKKEMGFLEAFVELD